MNKEQTAIYFGLKPNCKPLRLHGIDTGNGYLDCFLYALFQRLVAFKRNITIVCSPKTGEVSINDPVLPKMVHAPCPRISNEIRFAVLEPSGVVGYADTLVSQNDDLKRVFKLMKPLLGKLAKEEEQAVKTQFARYANESYDIAFLGWFAVVPWHIICNLNEKYPKSVTYRKNAANKTVTIYPIGSNSSIATFFLENGTNRGIAQINECSFDGSFRTKIMVKRNLVEANRLLELSEERLLFLTKKANLAVGISASVNANTIPICGKIKVDDAVNGKKTQARFYIPIVKKNGEVTYTRVAYPTILNNAKGTYHLSHASLEDARSQGHPMVRDMSKVAKAHNGSGFEDLQTESVLMQLGYSVAQNKPITREQRKAILLYAMRKGIMKRDRVIRFIRWLIRTHPQEKYEVAVHRWWQDLSYVQSCKCTAD